MPRSMAKSRLEALLSMATGAAAEVPAGLAGLYGAATGGSVEAARMIDKVRDNLTYQPRDPRGQQEIASVLGPIMQKIEAGKSYLGDGAFKMTGSPALAAAAYTAPDALLALLGARPALAAGRSASEGIGALVRRSARLPSPSMGSPVSQIGAIRAYHGSPHDFDRFSMNHIGTGEGAQAYGHGLYFAGKPEVARQYAGPLSAARATQPVGNVDLTQLYQSMPNDVPDNLLAARRDFRELQGMGELSAADRRDYLQAVQNNIVGGKGGNLYEVELAPDESDLLDWDAPLSEQPDGAQKLAMANSKALVKRLKEFKSNRLNEMQGDETIWNGLDGTDLYRALGDSRAASEALRQAGIPGIRYLDGGSRAAGDGSRNYVMFDDSLIKILGKK